MRVFMRYGKGEIDLGEMPILPMPEDRVVVSVPADMVQQLGYADNTVDYLLIGRRTFEQRLSWISLADLDLDPIKPRLDWVCVLTSQEDR